MKIVISIDSLKGSLSSIEAANAIKKGILNADINAEIVIMPLAGWWRRNSRCFSRGNEWRRAINICYWTNR